jgi:hypothetical protein
MVHLNHISKIKSTKEVTNHRIHIFLGLLDPGPDPLVRNMDPDPGLALDLDPSNVSKYCKKNHDFYLFMTFYL